LAKEGVNVICVARREDVLAEAVMDLQRSCPDPATRIIGVAADITSAQGRQRVFECPDGPGLRFDIVVTNSGGPPPGDFRDWTEETWLAAIRANMYAPIALIQATVDGMAERGFGRIVNITSGAVKAPIADLGLSNGARSGLTGVVAGLARSPLAAANVTINNLLPGAFLTDRLRSASSARAQAQGTSLETVLQERTNGVPARRLGSPDEFGAMCAYLCSQHAGYITGQNILMDGGAYPGVL